MITLARHIELLLLEHDCVIVPGLGGFIASGNEACYNEEDDRLYIPAYRALGFNQQLKINDGLLVQSYMAAYDTAYPKALLQMEKEVNHVLIQLDITGQFTFENIGTITKNLSEGITFTPQDMTILTPTLYGLHSYEFVSLAEAIKQREYDNALSKIGLPVIETENDEDKKTVPIKDDKQDSPEGTSIDTNKTNKDVVIKLNRRWFDVGIAAAVAALLCFFLSNSALKERKLENDTTMAAVVPQVQAVQSGHKNIETKKENTNKDKKIVEKSKAEYADKADAMTAEETTIANKKEETTQTKQQPDVAKDFSIVLASCVSETNATTFVEKLSKEGYTEARFVNNGKMNRVLYSAYASKEEAYESLATLRKQSNEFADAWVININE